MTYDVWFGDRYESVPVASSARESVMTPNVNGLVYRGDTTSHLLMQRRDKPGEPVRGLLELPGGRWRAGELPETAVVREVEEETGVRVTAVCGAGQLYRPSPEVGVATVRPLAVVSGFIGAFPSVHVLFECRGEGEPRPSPGETADPAWWKVAEVRELLHTSPGAFVPQAYSMLVAAGLGG